jgi:Ran GTPase-activating protein (RanGAP) involved in mRNA processing and transport
MTHIQKSYEALGDDGLRQLLEDLARTPAELPSVVELDIGGNHLTKAAVAHLACFLPRVPNLEELDLRDNKAKEGIRDLVPAFPFRLQRVDLSNNYVRDYGAQCLGSWLATTGTLTDLELTDNQIGVPGAVALAQALQGGRGLRRLSLAYNQLGDEGAAAVAGGLTRNQTLKDLDLSDNDIGDPGSEALAGVLSVSTCRLTALNLSVNRVGVEGGRALAVALAKNRTLTHLDLGCNPAGTPVAIAFAQTLERNSCLLSLDLSTCQLDGGCIPALEKALAGNSTLTDLGLMCNEAIGIAAMEPLFQKFRQNREEYEARQAALAEASHQPWYVAGIPGPWTLTAIGVVVSAVAIAVYLSRRRR